MADRLLGMLRCLIGLLQQASQHLFYINPFLLFFCISFSFFFASHLCVVSPAESCQYGLLGHVSGFAVVVPH